jgi:hypothetical protein
MLLHEIKKKATPEDARQTIRRFLKIIKGKALRPLVNPLSLEEPRKELLSAMAGVVLGQDRLSAADIEVLAWALINVPFWDLPDGLGGELVRRISMQEDVRRAVFDRGLREWIKNGEPDGRMREHWAWQDVLQCEDIDWLAEMAQRMQKCPDLVWSLLLGLTHRGPEDKPCPTGQKQRIGRLVRSRAPKIHGAVMRYRRDSARRQQQQQQRERRRLDKVRRFAVCDIVGDIIARPELDIQQKLWQLSWICFVEPSFRPRNVDGEWPNLPDGLKESVLNTCLSGLLQCIPTAIADGQKFNAMILHEAAAFAALLRYRDPRDWLTPEIIEKWLPCVFRASGNEESWVCSKCARVSTLATQNASLGWLDRELRQENASSYVRPDVPSELWDAGFAEEVAKRIRDPNNPPSPRIGLLRRLADRVPSQARRIAEEWARTMRWSQNNERPLLEAGLDVLLAISPQEGWPAARQLYEAHGKAVLLSLDSICGGITNDRKLNVWPNDALAELGIILHRDFPPMSAVHEEGMHEVDREDEARWARDAVTQILLSRGEAARTALQSLANAVPVVQNWLTHHQVQTEAGQILAATEDRAALQLSEVLRLLAEADYRLIRNESDLCSVLVETLTERIAENVGDHVEMLYDRQHKHLREDALQAYVACRLKDLLPGKVLHRETKIKRRQRTDVLVEAPSVSGPIVGAVIEVKWSDNRSIKDSVGTQLGQRYLLDERMKCGIFLVGWSGRSAWGGLRTKTAEGLLKALQRQARRFMTNHQDTSIRVVALDLHWSSERLSPPGATVNVRPGDDRD